MKRLLAAIACLLAFAVPAHAQQTKAALTAEINTNWPDNTTGAITPALLRNTVIDIVNSYQDLNGTSAFNCSIHTWVSSFANLSLPACTQPNFTDLAGGIATGQIGGGVNATTGTYLNGALQWTTPAGVGTVTEQKNTAGAGLTTSGNCDNTSTNAGSPCEYDFAAIANGRVLANVGGSMAAPTATTQTFILDTIGSTQGDILYRGSSAWAALAPATLHNVLVSGGAGANPSWTNSITVTSVDATGSLSAGGSVFFTGIGASTGNYYLCFITSNDSVAYDTTCGVSAKSRKDPTGEISAVDALAAFKAMPSSVPVWRYKPGEGAEGEHVGLYADDVEKMDKRCALYEDGKLKNYDERCVIAYLVVVVKQQQKEILRLKKRIK